MIYGACRSREGLVGREHCCGITPLVKLSGCLVLENRFRFGYVGDSKLEAEAWSFRCS